jgi:hypothetical protein
MVRELVDLAAELLISPFWPRPPNIVVVERMNNQKVALIVTR